MTNTDYKYSPPVWVVIPAAGVGKRMQANRPKQYLPLLNHTVIEQTIACFAEHDAVTGIIVALHRNDPYWKDLEIKLSIPLLVVEGGKERSDSVLKALLYLENELAVDNRHWVMVHDAARPCLLKQDIDQLIHACDQSDSIGGILAKKASDTMKRSNDSQRIQFTENRDNLWHALTPQMFPLGLLLTSLHHALEKEWVITDEASALECYGETPCLVEAIGSNIKITQPDDLALAEFLLAQYKK
ncbi:MAG: 2-C-methyl-D-erythritol 4-phosphate cytidylyltransferase [Cocleimonas sp.]|nr:2-C-methyl-D-erythritol 4-phosphate cytidylyltransferase [Cocleimonas sp.]